ncbi:phage tail sheath family protein [Psychroflexus sediminis]|uniref:Tail sheath protein C-terminal domain-containing protein n=1 Tax=Psychroflexus sediminis TaxID=470826 RepID=A0A1G7XD04_9FLAO|nr:phage tail sheath C-terminal domain-containing protein [Psychroflexus sediminis]SDG82122.1 hypothetical protein SAMN04488027_10836 [Psychroflexus sediminis]
MAKTSNLPHTIPSVETAVPAFVGYTQKAEADGLSLLLKPTRISSILEYESYFGGRSSIENITVILGDAPARGVKEINISNTEHYLMYDSLRLFFNNEGRDCFIVSVGFYGTAPSYGDEADPYNLGLRNGLKALETYDEPSLILFPDAVNVVTDGNDDPAFYHLQQMALQQCAELQDRFCIFDLKENISGAYDLAVKNLRYRIGTSNLKFAAVYSPFLVSSFHKDPKLSSFENSIYNSAGESLSLLELCFTSAETDLLNTYSEASDEETRIALQVMLYQGTGVIAQIATAIKKKLGTLPPSGAIAGLYAMVDSSRGVWKAPANVSINGILGLTKEISNDEQANLNVHHSGKSINVIRSFPEKGVLVWGARTLAGNDNEWRYVPVRRFVTMVEESVKKACAPFMFEPNDAGTWARVRALIEDYLSGLWRDGALAGAKPEQAFFVKVDLGESMTAQDIVEGQMNIEIGLSVVRPAEFIIIRFSLQMVES